MNQQTRTKLDETIDALDAQEGVCVTGVEVQEFIRGDPTDEDNDPSGAEFDVTFVTSYDDAEDDENPFRVK